jgi:[histone H3]-trimethyl-L-lysine4 demethylase
LIIWADRIPSLPFQPEEEEVLNKIINNAQEFRTHIQVLCTNIVSTESEADTQRFFLRKIEGAEILLAYETNFFRQELHKWYPVAPKAPPVLEVSKSTRKPRPTKLQKLLAQYGVEEIEELPEKEQAKAWSLKRKQQNAEAMAAAIVNNVASSATAAAIPPYAEMHPLFGQQSHQSSATPPGSAGGTGPSGDRRRSSTLQESPMAIDSAPNLHPGLFMPNGSSGPQLVNSDMSAVSLEERLLSGQGDVNLRDPQQRSKALEILQRTELGRKRAEEIFGPGVWHDVPGMRRSSPVPTHRPHDERVVDRMFDDLTHSSEDKSKEAFDSFVPTAESLESERNGMDALLDGE